MKTALLIFKTKQCDDKTKQWDEKTALFDNKTKQCVEKTALFDEKIALFDNKTEQFERRCAGQGRAKGKELRWIRAQRHRSQEEASWKLANC